LIIHRGPRDEVRRFPGAARAVIFARAGGRCEHHSWLGSRCAERRLLEADHVHPHSRGGWTNVANGQALCRRHNRFKRATVPFEWQLRRPARRRAGYFPAGFDPLVRRRAAHRPRPMAQSPTPGRAG
jgi:5-methylcytosine-specific restriction endonuclease McrA